MYVTSPSGPVSAVVDHSISRSSPSRVRQWNSARTGDSPARSARMPSSAICRSAAGIRSSSASGASSSAAL